jgi:D-sedoheptulose 7-phosphate isomerase
LKNVGMQSSSRMELHFEQHQRVVEVSFAKLRDPLAKAGDALVEALKDGKKVFAFGNGGSAAEASHFVGRFSSNRRPLPAVALSNDPAVLTCIANDFGYEALFERQIEALAANGDVVVGFTTSGNSENVRRGLSMAKKRGATTVVLTGASGMAGSSVDHLLDVPSTVTARIQEVHLFFLHVWCDQVDRSYDQDESNRDSG